MKNLENKSTDQLNEAWKNANNALELYGQNMTESKYQTTKVAKEKIEEEMRKRLNK